MCQGDSTAASVHALHAAKPGLIPAPHGALPDRAPKSCQIQSWEPPAPQGPEINR